MNHPSAYSFHDSIGQISALDFLALPISRICFKAVSHSQLEVPLILYKVRCRIRSDPALHGFIILEENRQSWEIDTEVSVNKRACIDRFLIASSRFCIPKNSTGMQIPLEADQKEVKCTCQQILNDFIRISNGYQTNVDVLKALYLLVSFFCYRLWIWFVCTGQNITKYCNPFQKHYENLFSSPPWGSGWLPPTYGIPLVAS